MAKPKVVGTEQRMQRRRRSAESADAVEGQIAEICRDLAAQMKRLRQLQEQADELRLVFREWASHSEPTADRAPTKSNRGGRC